MNELQLTYQGDGQPYTVIQDAKTGQVWNGSDFEIFDPDHLADYAIALDSLGGDLYSADFPQAVPGGTLVRVTYYEQAGDAPDAGDLILASAERYWTGAVLTTSPAATPPAASHWLTQTDIEAVGGARRVVQCADDDADGAADPSVMEFVLAAAEAEVEAALSRYVFPVYPAPAKVRELGAQAAFARLLKRRPETFQDDDGGGRLVKRIEEELEQIRQGNRDVPGLSLRSLAASAQAAPEDSGPVFTRRPDNTSGLDQF